MIEGRGPHGDPYIAGTRLGFLYLCDSDHFGSAMFGKNSRSHSGSGVQDDGEGAKSILTAAAPATRLCYTPPLTYR